MVKRIFYDGRPIIHAFCVDCGAPVIAYCGSTAQYALIRATAPVCGCKPDSLNKDSEGRQIWHKGQPRKDLSHAAH